MAQQCYSKEILQSNMYVPTSPDLALVGGFSSICRSSNSSTCRKPKFDSCPKHKLYMNWWLSPVTLLLVIGWGRLPRSLNLTWLLMVSSKLGLKAKVESDLLKRMGS